MAYLVDTNLLLRSVEPHHPMYGDTVNAISTLAVAGIGLFVASQNLVEFWRSATRPVDRNGLGFTVAEAEAELQRLETLFPVLPDVPEIYPEWRRIVLQYRVMGVNVHDARLVAVMRVHGLTHILTFNTGDFTRYSGEITSIHPATVTP
ncbi:PIN domain nuclease [Nostoc sp. CENA543]|uniref:type II toxin-antitoxin system VapC family toxin n=1 Tax=Nostoc sp. CENA543 TaxID=1869241 RepID=UPI000CA2EDBD|nr:PIN domain-containing protein [Nostoc sp. CENA543]AUT01826.1 PIN domain nuclease [Nostoc sp. CENA543]